MRATLAALAAALLLVFVVTQHAPQSEPAPLCMDRETREKVRGLMHDALDAALRGQIQHAFDIWMRDEREQPARARRGIEQAIRAYIGARRNTQNWNPPSC